MQVTIAEAAAIIQSGNPAPVTLVYGTVAARTEVFRALIGHVPVANSSPMRVLDDSVVRSRTRAVTFLNALTASRSAAIGARPDSERERQGFVANLEIGADTQIGGLALLVEYIPTCLQLVILCDNKPGLPLARLRVRRALREIRVSDA